MPRLQLTVDTAFLILFSRHDFDFVRWRDGGGAFGFRLGLNDDGIVVIRRVERDRETLPVGCYTCV